MAKGTGRTETRAAPRIPVRVRAALETDRAAVDGLRLQMEETHARLLPDYFRVAALPGRSPVSSTTGSGVGPSSVILVAEGRGQGALGYVSVNVVETPADPTMTPRRRAHVDAVVVDKAHRGAGVGTALMRAAADWARRREAVELVLTVWSDNEAAEALYRRLGYQPLARVMRQPL